MSKPETSIRDTRTMYYVVKNASDVPGLSSTQVYDAVAQAFSIWSAYTPLVFIRKTEDQEGYYSIDFWDFGNLNSALGLSNPVSKSIDINIAHTLMLDKYRNNVEPQAEQYDLVSAIAHEIGHCLFYDDGHSETGGGIMMHFQPPIDIIRIPNAEEIDKAQSKAGIMFLSDTIPFNLDTAIRENENDRVTFSKSSEKIVASGEERTTCEFSLTEDDLKEKRLNSLVIRTKLFSKYAILNKIELYDGATLLSRQYLSFSSQSSAPLTKNFKIGLNKKPVIKNGLKIKIELRFTDYLSGTASPSINKIEIKSIKAETIRHYSNVVLGTQTP